MRPYYISFDTKDTPGRLRAVRIDIGYEYVKNRDKKLRIDLCDHPLYPELEQYVLANPSRQSGKLEP